jgi:hypothetical protein
VPFLAMAFIVHDMKRRKSQSIALGCVYGVDIIPLVIFGAMGWRSPLGPGLGGRNEPPRFISTWWIPGLPIYGKKSVPS